MVEYAIVFTKISMQVAAAKGLLTGCLTVTKKDGSVIDYSSGVDVSHSTLRGQAATNAFSYNWFQLLCILIKSCLIVSPGS
jgi:hypothetical protein